jgi:putative membrane protein
MDLINHARTRSISKGILIGLIAGLVGSVAKVAGEAIYEPRTLGQTPPPLVAAEKIAGHPMAHPGAVIQTIHYTFGALTGAVYGGAAEVFPIVTAGYGSVFGVVLQLLTHETLVPLAGLDVPASQQPAREHLSEFFSHILYGIAAEATRRTLRRRFT